MKSMRIFGVALMMLMAGGMQAQTVKETADSVVSGVKSGNVKEAYSKIKDSFELKRVNAEKLIGTWDYKEPAVYTTKGNILFRMAGSRRLTSPLTIHSSHSIKTVISTETWLTVRPVASGS